ncbi:hypothetical protein CRUP_019530 [Coryphaenoides rupestris]|nr:hypothetical protein CRUP_019530 [Coryphaenoides rupestris]
MRSVRKSTTRILLVMNSTPPEQPVAGQQTDEHLGLELQQGALQPGTPQPGALQPGTPQQGALQPGTLRHPSLPIGRSRLLHELCEVWVHPLAGQPVQAVVPVADGVGGDHHHPDPGGILPQLTADGRAHHHVQAAVGPAGVAVVQRLYLNHHPHPPAETCYLTTTFHPQQMRPYLTTTFTPQQRLYLTTTSPPQQRDHYLTTTSPPQQRPRETVPHHHLTPQQRPYLTTTSPPSRETVPHHHLTPQQRPYLTTTSPPSRETVPHHRLTTSLL